MNMAFRQSLTSPAYRMTSQVSYRLRIADIEVTLADDNWQCDA